jgi:DnaJ family protein C protein 25
MDIRGGYAKPDISKVLWIQLILLPVTTVQWIYFYARWFWKFGICKEEYGDQEKLHIIRRNMKLSTDHFSVNTTE